MTVREALRKHLQPLPLSTGENAQQGSVKLAFEWLDLFDCNRGLAMARDDLPVLLAFYIDRVCLPPSMAEAIIQLVVSVGDQRQETSFQGAEEQQVDDVQKTLERIAAKLLDRKMKVKDIADITGLREEEVKLIAAERKNSQYSGLGPAIFYDTILYFLVHGGNEKLKVEARTTTASFGFETIDLQRWNNSPGSICRFSLGPISAWLGITLLETEVHSDISCAGHTVLHSRLRQRRTVSDEFVGDGKA
eukprot:TRINITY_DN81687_c0_g1_i1.p1 TRINITY_DN81687_c0_g1~~TRINITY_DN81687_c0_g1_i1.p1  ORF type:complete len:257 (+),score=42.71 TRINITY_DN81687_c0_g1_i1:29-772(+)